METKHVTIIVGAVVLGFIGFYLAGRLLHGATAAPSIEDQMNAYK